MNLPSLNMSINKLPFVLAVYYLVVINIPLSLELFSIVQASKSESVVFLISIQGRDRTLTTENKGLYFIGNFSW